jgi:crossover junction endodeoxyribonuclease RuvC
MLTTPAGLPMPQRLKTLFRGMNQLMDIYQPDEVAFEELFFSKNITTGMAVSMARGVALVAVADRTDNLYEYTPMQIKQAVTGYGGADKHQVQMMVKMLLNMKEIAKQESEKVKQLKSLNKELVEDYNKLYEENKRLEDEVFKKDVEHQKEMEKLYEMIHQLSNERDRLKEQQTVPVNQPDPSKELLRENKQMKAFLRSIMNTCDTVRELEIA